MTKIRKNTNAIRNFKNLREVYEGLPDHPDHPPRTMLEMDVVTRFMTSIITAISYCKNEVYVNMTLASSTDFQQLTAEEKCHVQALIQVCL
jgi:hypothetical protein